MPNISPDGTKETVFLRGGSLNNRRKMKIPLDATEITFVKEAAGEFYFRTNEEWDGETIFEYRQV